MAQICRTCFQETSTPNYFEITNDEKSSQIKTEILLCIPEINLNLLSNPILCTPCLAALSASYRFKKQCLYTEERIRSYLSATKNCSEVKIIDVYKSSSLVGYVFSTNDLAVLTPKRNYIDDLNDLLDDALNNTDVKVSVPVQIKQEDVSQIEQNIIANSVMPDKQAQQTLKQETGTNVRISTLRLMKCKHCPFNTKHWESFELHKKEHGDKLEYFSCTNCSYKTTFKHNLLKHSHRHETSKVLSCRKCSYTTFEKYALQKHDVVAHPNKTVGVKSVKNNLKKDDHTFRCNTCNFSSKTAGYMEVHIRKEHKRKMFLCLICKKITSTQYNLDKHIEARCSKQKLTSPTTSGTIYKCKYCTYNTTRYHGYVLHMKCHSKSLTIKCKLCTFNAKNSFAYAAHMRKHLNMRQSTKVTTNKPFLCKLCNFKTATQKDLNIHMMRTHQSTTETTCYNSAS